MLPVVVTSNEIIGNMNMIEAVSMTLVDVQEHQMVQTLLAHC